MAECAVSDCTASASKRGWCGKHYLRWWRHGDPLYLLARYSQCQIDGCDKPVRSSTSGMCEMHYYRLRRHGDPNTVLDTRREDANYRTAHGRITKDRGPARNRACTDCGQPAHHWSYAHSDPDERHSPGGQPFSLNPEHYDPRCAPCHARFDGTGANQHTA